MSHPIREILEKLPSNPIIGYHIHQGLVNRFYREAKELNTLVSRLLGTKLNKTQLARSIISIGYIADDENIIRHNPITSNVFTGLTEDEFFECSYGTRKGIVDKQKVTPDSGYLERSMVLNLSPIDIDQHDCGSQAYFEIEILSEQHKTLLANRWFLNTKTNSLRLFNPIEHEVGEKLFFRSPITCWNPDYRICRKCFGNYNITSPFVGILAGQYVSERITQLSMRSFHTSGSCSIETNSDVVNYIENHLIDIEYTEDNNIVMLIFNEQINEYILGKFVNITGFETYDWNRIIFQNYIPNIIENPDVTAVLKNIKNVLKVQPTDPTPIEKAYKTFMTNIMSVGDIYSSFIEVVFCNLYECKNKFTYRYELKRVWERSDFENISPLAYKYAIRTLCSKISKTLNLLYEPNIRSITNIKSLHDLDCQTKNIFEQIWLGLL